jgi:hypothetical protein
MQPVDESKFKKFVEEKFPEGYNSMERWEEYIRNKIKAHSSALSSVMTAVKNIIESLNKEYSKKEKRVLAKVIKKSIALSMKRKELVKK